MVSLSSNRMVTKTPVLLQTTRTKGLHDTKDLQVYDSRRLSCSTNLLAPQSLTLAILDTVVWEDRSISTALAMKP